MTNKAGHHLVVNCSLHFYGWNASKGESIRDVGITIQDGVDKFEAFETQTMPPKVLSKKGIVHILHTLCNVNRSIGDFIFAGVD